MAVESLPTPEDRSETPVFALHRGGKIEVNSKVPSRDRADLSRAYTPGVAEVCLAIADQPDLVHDYTWKSSTVAVVTDGTAVLGLGDIGPAASLPVMEGKPLLCKQCGGVDAVPIAIDSKDVDHIVETVIRIAPAFGGINLEDISAARCFRIEGRLKERLDMPVFHDDQHGTAVVVLAALENAAKLTGRTLADLRAVVSGAGAAGVACTKILLEAGIGDVAIADSKGLLHEGRDGMTAIKMEMAGLTNKVGLVGTIEEALEGAEVYIGVSSGKVADEAVATMAKDSIIFALANPNPEIHPDVGNKYARVMATGRSDFPNQINNVLAFPGIFRGALNVRASAITENMKLAAADAIAAVVGDDLSEDCVIPSVFDERVGPAVAAAVAQAAQKDGVARR